MNWRELLQRRTQVPEGAQQMAWLLRSPIGMTPMPRSAAARLNCSASAMCCVRRMLCTESPQQVPAPEQCWGCGTESAMQRGAQQRPLADRRPGSPKRYDRGRHDQRQQPGQPEGVRKTNDTRLTSPYRFVLPTTCLRAVSLDSV